MKGKILRFKADGTFAKIKRNAPDPVLQKYGEGYSSWRAVRAFEPKVYEAGATVEALEDQYGLDFEYEGLELVDVRLYIEDDSNSLKEEVNSPKDSGESSK